VLLHAGRPNVFLRYGLARDKDIIREIARRQLTDAIVVPANILAHQAAVTPYYVRSFGVPYLIDPMSYLFSRTDWCRPEGGMRPSVAKLARTMGPAVEAICCDAGRALVPRDLGDSAVAEIANAAVRFQAVDVPETPSRRIAQYFRFLRKDAPTPSGGGPAAITAPYFHLEAGSNETSNWLDANMRVVDALRATGTPSVACVLFFSQEFLEGSDPGTWSQIVRSYAACAADTIFLWPDDFRDDFHRTGVGRGLADLVRALAPSGRTLISLYGGYYSLLLYKLGLSGISHGILYTQHRRSDAAGSRAGPPPVRYYFPAFHQFRTILQASRILQAAGNPVPCDCPVCQRTFAGDGSRIAEFEDLARAKMHFMSARMGEAEAVASQDLATLLAQLEATYQTWHLLVSGLPNPESAFGSYMEGLDHLQAWRGALGVS